MPAAPSAAPPRPLAAAVGPDRADAVGHRRRHRGRVRRPTSRRGSAPRAARRWYWRQTILSIAACLRGPDAPQPARLPEPRMSLIRRFDELRDDIVGALRQMRRAPAFTALAVDDAGPRHRRQQRHLRAGRRHAAAAAAGAASPDRLVIAVGAHRRRRIAQPRLAAQHDRLARPHAQLRGHRRLRAARRRDGDAGDRRRRERRCRASGSPPGSSTSSACARSSAARSPPADNVEGAPDPRSSRRNVLAHALRRRSQRRRPRSSASTASPTPSSASCRATSSSPGGPASGRS